ncbi:MAG: hypothetical protein HQ581_25215 [Planctomycetes bacterium]|nr:hypothetical protein [Planctomycetota bacterium]
MQVNPVLGGLSDATAYEKRTERVESGGVVEPADMFDAVGTTRPIAPAFHEVLADYDVTDISPQEFSEMIQQLHQSGAVSDRELQELALVRLDLDLAGVDADEPLNLLQFYRRSLFDLQDRLDDPEQAAGVAEALEGVAERVAWLEKFATIQAIGMESRLDTLA